MALRWEIVVVLVVTFGTSGVRAVLAAVVLVVVLATVAVTSSDGDTTASGPRTVNDALRKARSDAFAEQDYVTTRSR
ncbi:hypothetical protein CXF32_03915 [Corynebacterium bovis]|nr:hypothetical protein CXF32_03915 [Corynebacterium bovis]